MPLTVNEFEVADKRKQQMAQSGEANIVGVPDRGMSKLAGSLGNVPTVQSLTQMMQPAQNPAPIAPAVGGPQTPPAPPEPVGPPDENPFHQYGWLTPLLYPLEKIFSGLQRAMITPSYLGKRPDPVTGVYTSPSYDERTARMKEAGLGPLVTPEQISPGIAGLAMAPANVPDALRVWKETGRNPIEQMAEAWDTTISAEKATARLMPDEVRGVGAALGAAASNIAGIGIEIAKRAAFFPVVATTGLYAVIKGERVTDRYFDAVKQQPGILDSAVHDIAKAYDDAAMDRDKSPFALTLVNILDPGQVVVASPVMAVGKLGLKGLGNIPIVSPYMGKQLGTFKDFLGTNLFERTIFSKGNAAEEVVQDFGIVLHNNYDLAEGDIRGLVRQLRTAAASPIVEIKALGTYFDSHDSVVEAHGLMNKYAPELENIYKTYVNHVPKEGETLSSYQLIYDIGEVVRYHETAAGIRETMLKAGNNPFKKGLLTAESMANTFGFWWKPMALFTRPVYIANNIASGLSMEAMRSGSNFMYASRYRDLLVREGILHEVESSLGTMFAKRIPRADLTPPYLEHGQVLKGGLPELYKNIPVMGKVMEWIRDQSARSEISLKETSFINALIPAREAEMGKWLGGLPEEIRPLFAGANGVDDTRQILGDILSGSFNPLNHVRVPGSRPGVATLLDTEIQTLRDKKVIPTVAEIDKMFDQAEGNLLADGVLRKHHALTQDPPHRLIEEEIADIIHTKSGNLRSQHRMEQSWADQMDQSTIQLELLNDDVVAEVAKSAKNAATTRSQTVRLQNRRYLTSEAITRHLENKIKDYTDEFSTSTALAKQRHIPKIRALQQEIGDIRERGALYSQIDTMWKAYDDDAYDIVERFARKKDNLHLIAAEARVQGWSTEKFEATAKEWYKRDDTFRVSAETNQLLTVAGSRAQRAAKMRQAVLDGFGGNPAHISGIPIQSWTSLVNEDGIKDLAALAKARLDFHANIDAFNATRFRQSLPPLQPGTTRLYAQEGGDLTTDLGQVVSKVGNTKEVYYIDLPTNTLPVWSQPNGYFAIPETMQGQVQKASLVPLPEDMPRLLGGQTAEGILDGAKNATYNARDWAVMEAKRVQFDAATDKRNFDRIMSSVYPFSFWTTRYFSFLAQQAAKNPTQAYLAGKFMRAWWDANEGLPSYERFSIKVAVIDQGTPDEITVRLNPATMLVPFGAPVGEVIDAVNKEKADELSTVLAAMANLVGGGAYPFVAIPAGMLGVSLDGGVPKSPIDTLKGFTPPSNILRQGVAAGLSATGELGAGAALGAMTQAEVDGVIRKITDDVNLGQIGPEQGRQAVLSLESGNPTGIALDYLQEVAPQKFLTSIGRAIAPPVTAQDLSATTTALAYETLREARTRSEKDLVYQNFPGLQITLSGKRGPEREQATIHLQAPKSGVARSLFYQQQGPRLATLRLQTDQEDGVEPSSYLMKSASPESFQAFRLAGGADQIPVLVKWWFDATPLPDTSRAELYRLYNEAPMGALTYKDWRDRLLLDGYMQWTAKNIKNIRVLRAQQGS